MALTLDRIPERIRPFCKGTEIVATTEICRKVLRNVIEAATRFVKPSSVVVETLSVPQPPPASAPLRQRVLPERCDFALADRTAPPDFVEEDEVPDAGAEDPCLQMHFQCISLRSQLPPLSKVEKVFFFCLSCLIIISFLSFTAGMVCLECSCRIGIFPLPVDVGWRAFAC